MLGRIVPRVVSYGVVECREAPMGAHGIEGVMLGERYPFYLCERADVSLFYRVFASEADETAYRYGLNFGECWDLTRGLFRRLFTISEEQGGNPIVELQAGAEPNDNFHGYKPDA